MVCKHTIWIIRQSELAGLTEEKGIECDYYHKSLQKEENVEANQICAGVLLVYACLMNLLHFKFKIVLFLCLNLN